MDVAAKEKSLHLPRIEPVVQPIIYCHKNVLS
jgi:hypothetical protein